MSRRTRTPRVDSVVVTCEHGGNKIPRAYQKLFRPHRALLESHRGWDPGALELARRFARTLHAPLLFSTTSRLLVELNRSVHHRAVFSIATAKCEPVVKKAILRRYYWPYRASVVSAIQDQVRRNKTVLHLSVHSFTPVLDGAVRRADVGLLYDPERMPEREFAEHWRNEVRCVVSQETFSTRQPPKAPNESSGCQRLRVRRNYPYLGSADGFTTYLRTRFPASRYLGIELEVNQRFVMGNRSAWLLLQNIVVRSLVELLAQHGDRP